MCEGRQVLLSRSNCTNKRVGKSGNLPEKIFGCKSWIAFGALTPQD